MNKNITHYCSKCGKITKWRNINPKGKWYCTQCKAESEVSGADKEK